MLTSIVLDHLSSGLHHTGYPQTPLWPFTGLISRAHQNRVILSKLEQPVSMAFANETPLADALAYVRSATAGPNDSGIPIYVDPVGLYEAGKTIRSPVTLDVEGAPLRTTLRLLLMQLGLDYVVEDGMLKIGRPSTASIVAPFHRMGHYYWALLAAFCGGYAGRALHNTRARETVPPGA